MNSNADSSPAGEQSPDHDWLKARIIAGASVAGTFVYVLVAWLMLRGGARTETPLSPAQLKTLFDILVMAAVACFLLSIALRRYVLRSASRRALARGKGTPANFDRRLHAVIISCAVAEASAIMGLVYFFLGGKLQDAVLLFAIALIGKILAFPRNSRPPGPVGGEGEGG